MSDYLEVTLLGSGSSGGVPRADGDWGACDPDEPRNLRTRCSLAVRRKKGSEQSDETTLLIDLSPDFRLQAVRAGIRRLDAVLFSHDHADQTHGIDDIRAFAYRQRSRIACQADAATIQTLTRRFGYVFEGLHSYPPIATLMEIPRFGEPFEIAGPSGGIPVIAYDQDHGDVRAVGYRIGDVGYSSDVVGLPEASMQALQNLDVFIVDALRYTPHPTHLSISEALEMIRMLRPKRAVLTNLSSEVDYETLRQELPANVEPAYDGMRLTA